MSFTSGIANMHGCQFSEDLTDGKMKVDHVTGSCGGAHLLQGTVADNVTAWPHDHKPETAIKI